MSRPFTLLSQDKPALLAFLALRWKRYSGVSFSVNLLCSASCLFLREPSFFRVAHIKSTVPSLSRSYVLKIKPPFEPRPFLPSLRILVSLSAIDKAFLLSVRKDIYAFRGSSIFQVGLIKPEGFRSVCFEDKSAFRESALGLPF